MNFVDLTTSAHTNTIERLEKLRPKCFYTDAKSSTSWGIFEGSKFLLKFKNPNKCLHAFRKLSPSTIHTYTPILIEVAYSLNFETTSSLSKYYKFN